MLAEQPDVVLEAGLWFSLLTLVLEAAYRSYIRYRESEKKTIFFPLFVFFVTQSISHALGIVHKFFCNASFCFIIEKTSGIIGMCGAIYPLYFVARKTFSRKIAYGFLVGPLILLMIHIFVVDVRSLPLYVMLPLSVVYGLTLPTIYFYLALKTGGPIRKKSLVLDIGWVLYLAGLALQKTNVEPSANWLIIMWESATGIPFGIIGPTLMLLAIPCFYYGYFEEE